MEKPPEQGKEKKNQPQILPQYHQKNILNQKSQKLHA